MMNKKVILATGVALAVVGGAGVALTRAFFSAQQTTTGNKFTVGTLDLAIGQNVADPFVVENIGAEGNISGGKTWTIHNTGSLPGRLYMRVRNLNNISSGCINEPKKLADPQCGADGHEGNLGGVLKTVVSLDGENVITDATLASADKDKYGSEWAGLEPVVIDAGASKTVGFNWSATENDYGNEIQGDSVQFDIEYNMVQLIEGTPANVQ